MTTLVQINRGQLGHISVEGGRTNSSPKALQKHRQWQRESVAGGSTNMLPKGANREKFSNDTEVYIAAQSGRLFVPF